ncbi:MULTISPECIES: hypothetical protein [unclassified Rhizobium]|uniref:hypothetical protein n=1 Tax=unclassified Rhizobium TaxID=2613769 RepID=UPI001ADD01D5|nr:MULTISPECIES: hypothetical protein [unclassified Rhizobium]MBO9101438.1 hypothetical protein [Rhizobium sp. L58/93]MBO9187429.1 hypothetical protein [Rhizobium sp. E27B/91]QXZ86779.1 hypothetical protein J5287_19380 [Rhizobium sp. K1/93]QXZ93188.1 hypothetical protein J5280_21515 [Rhizobium sp. K15/93]
MGQPSLISTNLEFDANPLPAALSRLSIFRQVDCWQYAASSIICAYCILVVVVPRTFLWYFLFKKKWENAAALKINASQVNGANVAQSN